jgi:hypothetical protein
MIEKDTSKLIFNLDASFEVHFVSRHELTDLARGVSDNESDL